MRSLRIISRWQESNDYSIASSSLRCYGSPISNIEPIIRILLYVYSFSNYQPRERNISNEAITAGRHVRFHEKSMRWPASHLFHPAPFKPRTFNFLGPSRRRALSLSLSAEYQFLLNSVRVRHESPPLLFFVSVAVPGFLKFIEIIE